MTSAVIVADDAADLARLTVPVAALADVDVVRVTSGHTSVGRLMASHQPALVVIGELSPQRLALERLAEIRATAPRAAVVVLAPAGSRWLGEALRAGAAAVVPGAPSARALTAVLRDVLAPDSSGVASVASAA
jgi:DNA-binding NarL/FixJ family response regulator